MPTSPQIPDDKLGDRDRSREAWSMGIGALVLTALQACAPITAFAAVPLGWIAMSRARTLLADPEIEGITEVYARTAQITGTIALVVSGIWAAFICLFLGGYASIFIAAMYAASMQNGSVP